jgi:hypothetical protein
MRMSGALLAALVLITPASPAAAASSDGPAYFWRWSDGSEARSRTFAEHDFGVPSRLPRVVVQAHPAAAGVRVVLQARVRGAWRTEDAARTGPHGAARLQLNPYCGNGDWCRTAFDYRLLVDGREAAVHVAFTG